MIALGSEKTERPELPMGRLNTATFAMNFNRSAFQIDHHLRNHKLFELESLADLIRQLPDSSIENVSNQDGPSRRTDMQSPVEVHDPDAWMVLSNVEQVPVYQDLLNECLDQIELITEKIAPGMSQRQGHIIISPPNSITPFQVDPQNTFILQVQGQQQIHVFDPADRQILPEQKIECVYSGLPHQLKFEDRFMGKGNWFDLAPGAGLHCPVMAPYWIQNGSQVSVAFHITFQTDQSKRRESLHRFNRKLRRFGLNPSPVGRDSRRDAAKQFVFSRFQQTANLWRKG